MGRLLPGEPIEAEDRPPQGDELLVVGMSVAARSGPRDRQVRENLNERHEARELDVA